ncbi:hypothetical protein [Paraburkholderia sp. CNPSo 3281]|uniref:hypothetical protein n=1 Tax=Paraburkholderia sp. CNPSo 3281 TaxID=2940933 RepID=UPI0020B784BA|nr:hypothetical protein [Paraburkholderia sp. CNPSo 3281]MCP3720814.1 hypothetical protein [Paraburkholderia sp. CNPSo 3281]
MTHMRYGSLLFGLGIYGLDQVARLLDQNFDTFVAVTEGLIYSNLRDHFGLDADAAEITIHSTPEARGEWDSVGCGAGDGPQLTGVRSAPAPDEVAPSKEKINRIEYFSRLVLSGVNYNRRRRQLKLPPYAATEADAVGFAPAAFAR